MNRLPVEMIQKIVQHLPCADLATLRRFNKTFARIVEPLLFEQVSVVIQLDMLKALEQILTNPNIGKHIKAIRISYDVYSDDWFFMPSDNKPLGSGSDIYKGFAPSFSSPIIPGCHPAFDTGPRRLSTILSQLPNLQHLELKDNREDVESDFLQRFSDNQIDTTSFSQTKNGFHLLFLVHALCMCQNRPHIPNLTIDILADFWGKPMLTSAYKDFLQPGFTFLTGIDIVIDRDMSREAWFQQWEILERMTNLTCLSIESRVPRICPIFDRYYWPRLKTLQLLGTMIWPLDIGYFCRRHFDTLREVVLVDSMYLSRDPVELFRFVRENSELDAFGVYGVFTCVKHGVERRVRFPEWEGEEEDGEGDEGKEDGEVEEERDGEMKEERDAERDAERDFEIVREFVQRKTEFMPAEWPDWDRSKKKEGEEGETEEGSK